MIKKIFNIQLKVKDSALEMVQTAFLLICMVSAIPSAASGSRSTASLLTLDQAVSIAVENAILVQKAQNEVDLSATQVLQGYGQFLPDLGLESSYSYSSGKTLFTISGFNIIDSNFNGATFNIFSTLNLFNGLADYSSLKAALEKRDASNYSLTWAKQQIALDVTQNYLQIVLDQKIVAIAQSNLEASLARLKLLQGQSEVGTASVSDLYRQEAQKYSDQIFLVNSETKLKDDQLLLIRKLRLDPMKNYEFESPPLASVQLPLFERTDDDLVNMALEHRKDLKARKSNAEESNWNVTRAKSAYYPRLNLVFNRFANGRYLHTQFLNGQNVLPSSQADLVPQLGNQVNYVVGITLTWNLFDRFLTRLDVQRAQTISNNLNLDYDDLRLKVIADVRQIKIDYQAALRQVESARVGVISAEKANATIAGRYQVGSSSFIDLLASQSALVQARSAYAQSMINLKLQEKIFEYTTGSLKVSG